MKVFSNSIKSSSEYRIS